MMTKDEMRIAIAEKCGWKHCDCGNPDCKLFWYLPGLRRDPIESLDAMHEAEKHLSMDRMYEYGEELRKASMNIGERGGKFIPNGFGCYALAHLRADQRAEAFCRVFWPERFNEKENK